jgi:sulfhydrogenase subunit beta (sulfur reductase)
MTAASPSAGANLVVAGEHFQLILDALAGRGYRLVGPVLQDGQLIYDDLTGMADLPVGWMDEQAGGRFRLKRRADQALFGYGVGQHSWKRWLFPPRQLLWQARRQGRDWQVLPPSETPPRYAFIGVHPCDLQAIAVQDRVFLEGGFADPGYRARREAAFILAVNCTQACGTGFCASMGTGPQAASGFDLALTEVLEKGRHFFLVAVGSERGAEILGAVPGREPTPGELARGESLVAGAAAGQGRVMETAGLKELLYANYEHPRWDEVTGRCLTCGNCASVCPTCFCNTLEDVTSLSGELAERWRRQDVCFTVDFSYLHGGSVRATPRSRYRQWLTHKLATWIDQFGCSGCVGCGRCITWCPVGIDLTEEVRAFRESKAGAGKIEAGTQLYEPGGK